MHYLCNYKTKNPPPWESTSIPGTRASNQPAIVNMSISRGLSPSSTTRSSLRPASPSCATSPNAKGALLAEWDIEPDDFKGIVSDYNERMQSKMVSQNRRKPEHDEAAGGRRKPGRRKKASATDQPDNEGKPKRKRGRPKGSGRKAPEKQPKKTGRKPGRPKGSKNKKTLAKEAAMAAAGIAPVKRPKGRPKGSKDSKPRKKAKLRKSVSEGLEK